MTEEEWVSGERMKPLLEFIQGKLDERKELLFGAAACRRIWHLLADPRSREVVAAAEMSVDGRIAHEQFNASMRDAVQACHDFDADSVSDWDAALHAGNTARWAAYHVDFPQWGPGEATTALCVSRGARNQADYRRMLEREESILCGLFRDIVGNPFRPAALPLSCITTTTVALARAAYDERILPQGHLYPERLAVLADALEEVGCADAPLLGHLRGPGPHVRGCWALDLVLGKE